MQNAYNIFVPPPDAHQSDKYKNQSEKFFNNLKKGNVDPKEFERYVYGGNYADRNKDDDDRAEQKVNDQIRGYKYQ